MPASLRQTLSRPPKQEKVPATRRAIGRKSIDAYLLLYGCVDGGEWLQEFEWPPTAAATEGLAVRGDRPHCVSCAAGGSPQNCVRSKRIAYSFHIGLRLSIFFTTLFIITSSRIRIIGLSRLPISTDLLCARSLAAGNPEPSIFVVSESTTFVPGAGRCAP